MKSKYILNLFKLQMLSCIVIASLILAVFEVRNSFADSEDYDPDIDEITQDINNNAEKYLGGSRSGVFLQINHCELNIIREYRKKCDIPAQNLNKTFNIHLSEVALIRAREYRGTLFTAFELLKEYAMIADEAGERAKQLYQEKYAELRKHQMKEPLPTQINYEQKLEDISKKIISYLAETKMVSRSFISNCSGNTTYLSPSPGAYVVPFPSSTSPKLIQKLNKLKNMCSK